MSMPAVSPSMSYSNLLRLVMLASVVVSSLCLALYVGTTYRWPLVNDAGLMHYIAFLMDHGFAPYRDIKDMNFPGGLLIEWGVMHVFGPGAMAWRIYDLLLLGLAFPAMVIITWPNRFAGFLAAALFALFHGRDGVGQSGQRDFAVAVLLLLTYAFALLSARTGRQSRRLLYACASGITLAAATTVKPTAVLYAIPVIWILLAGKDKPKPYLATLISFSAGVAMVLFGITAFLSYKHSLVDFWRLSQNYLPFYSSLGRHTPRQLFHEAFYGSLTSITILAVTLFVTQRRWSNQLSLALIAAVACGYCSFYLQGKGFLYHRYSLVAFLFLLAAEEVNTALHGRWIFRVVALCGVIYMGLVLPPLYLKRASTDYWQEEKMVNALSNDLADIKRMNPGKSLDGDIQCLDTISGCINTLYRMGLVQKTGFISDEFFFNANLPPGLLRDRETFQQEVEDHPPRVFVVTQNLYPYGPQNYGKLDRWPAFATFLQSHYKVVDERSFTAGMTGPSGYRIYLLSY